MGLSFPSFFKEGWPQHIYW